MSTIERHASLLAALVNAQYTGVLVWNEKTRQLQVMSLYGFADADINIRHLYPIIGPHFSLTGIELLEPQEVTRLVYGPALVESCQLSEQQTLLVFACRIPGALPFTPKENDATWHLLDWLRKEITREAPDTEPNSALNVDEKKTLADRLHRGIAQIFFTIGLAAEAALESNDTPDLHIRIERIQQLAAQGNTETRALMSELQRSEQGIKKHPFVGLLEKKIQEIAQQTGAKARVIQTSTIHELPPELAVPLHQCVNQYLVYAQKNRKESILLSLHQDDDELLLNIQEYPSSDPTQLPEKTDEIKNLFYPIIEPLFGSVQLSIQEDEGDLIRVTFPLTGINL